MNNKIPRKSDSLFGGKNFDFNKVIQWLGFMLRCPICGFKYNLDQTKIIESERNEAFDEAHILIHSDCTKCKSSVMFNVEIHGPEIFSVGMVTDLTQSDSRKFKSKESISLNEVINIHQALKAFKGDIVSALKPELAAKKA